MRNSKNTAIIVSIFVVLAVGAWWYTHRVSYILPLASGDSVASWDFQGARKDGGTLEKGAKDEIARLEALLGGDQSGLNDDPTDYSLYVGIAAQYDGLGDGANERVYLEKALAIDSIKTGLAWHNLGSLMSRLGAYETARIAYTKAAEAQPKIINYHIARIQFLIDHFASDTAGVDGAFAEAIAKVGGDPAVLQLEAQWLEMSGRVQEAIAALKEMKLVMPPDSQSTIDSEIQRLEKR